jgi:3-phosphoshikimate 1-carboxyvinyltransferase
MTEVIVPGSKSITNRALILAAAAAGRTELIRPLVADDTVACAEGLTAMGYDLDTGDLDTGQGGRWVITGDPYGPPARTAEVFTRDAATGARFLPALAAAGHGVFRFDASAQMRARPMTPLLDGLRQLGAQIDSDSLPYTLTASGLQGGELTLDAGISSQYLTALLLAGPLTKDGLTITVTRLVSAPYIEITLRLMRQFGAVAHRDGDTFRVEGGGSTSPGPVLIEPDASTASYFLAAAAVTGHTVTLPGLGSGSAQGDLAFAGVLGQMGAAVELSQDSVTVTGPGVPAQLSGVTVNMHDISDTMPTLAAIAPLARGPVRIEDVYNTRVKECDRLQACADNLRSMGVPVRTGEDWIEISPAAPHASTVVTHRDHRIAMAFAVLGLRVPGLVLDDPGCVIKTCPQFHELLAGLAAAW